MGAIVRVCDGWDWPTETSAGVRCMLHFREEPSAAQMSEALRAYGARLAADAAAEEAARIEVETEDGGNV